MPTTETRQSVETKIVTRALKDEAYRKKLVSDPKSAKAEIERLLETTLPETFQVNVFQETADHAYLVIPPAPSNVASLTEEQLEAVASGGQTIATQLHTRVCLPVLRPGDLLTRFPITIAPYRATTVATAPNRRTVPQPHHTVVRIVRLFAIRRAVREAMPPARIMNRLH